MGQTPSQPIVPPCDAECQRQKRLTQLKETYNSSVQDETQDSAEVRQARKQYFTFKLGDAGYMNKERETLEKIADKHTGKLQNIHDRFIHDIKEQKEIENDNKISIKNMRELLDKFQSSNKKIMNGLDDQENVLETSRRMVWYTNQKVGRYRSFDSLIATILKLMLLIAITFFLYDQKYISLTLVIIFYLLIMHFL